MDLRYLRFTFLLLFLEENSCSKKKYYQCTYHKELFFKLLDKKDSEEMICWDSQLHDSTRILLTQKYNDYRREVARGTCPSCNIREKYQYMCEMKWHWILEKKAQKLLQKRNFTQQTASLSVNEVFSTQASELGYRFLQTKYLEYATTSFLLDELVDVGQISHVTRFLSHLNKTNILHDWAKQFRRQFVTFFGCSIAVIKVIKAEPSAYTALDEQIRDGDKILLMACVFASSIQNKFTHIFNDVYSNIPTTESCSAMKKSPQIAIYVKNDLCSFSDQTDVLAIITPCQIYYSHPRFVDVDMLSCPGDIPDYWNSYELLQKSNYSKLLVHLTDGTEMEFALKLLEETTQHLPSSASPAVIDYPLSNGLDMGEENSELNPLHDSFQVEYEWQSKKRRRAVETTTYSFELFEPKQWPPVFLPDELPGNPEKHTVFLSPIPVVNPFDAKYCIVVTLFYFIVFFTFCVLLSIIAKYYVEKDFFKTR